MSIVTLITILAGIIYVYLAVYGLRMKPRNSLINIFVALCLACALWALAIALMFAAELKTSAWLWFRLSAPGWCLGPALLLHFALVLTEDRRKPEPEWLVYVLYSTALFFTFLGLTKGLTATTLIYTYFGWSPLNTGQSLWYWAFTLYYIICVVAGIILVYRWGAKSKLTREKQQARLIVTCTVIGTILAFFNESLLPILGYYDIPKIPVVIWLIWALGFWVAITKYRFLAVTPVVATKQIVQSIDDMLIMLNADRRIVEINPRVNILLSYRHEDILWSSIDKIAAEPEKIKDILTHLESSTEDSLQEELNIITKQGELIPVQLSVAAIRDNFGDVICFVLVARDLRPTLALQKEICERIKAEEELKKAHADAERTHRELAESEKMAALGQLVAGVAHEINTPLGAINSSVGSISETVPLALQQIPEVFNILSAEGEEEFMRLLDIALNSDVVLSMREKRSLRKSMSESLERAGIPNAPSFADSLINLGIHEYEPKMQVLLLHPSNDVIFEALNNISSLIRGVKNIQTAIMKVRKIVFALKNFARFDNSGELISFDLREGIETVLTLYYHQIKQGIEVVRDYTDGAGTIPCYPDELNQVWTNLVNNALHAMDYNGTLTIGIRPASTGGEVLISIGDTGCGMNEETKEKIFAPFFTTKRAGEGSGLGLDIVKKIIDKHNGRIEVESELGQGTTFKIFLPTLEN